MSLFAGSNGYGRRGFNGREIRRIAVEWLRQAWVQRPGNPTDSLKRNPADADDARAAVLQTGNRTEKRHPAGADDACAAVRYILISLGA